MKEHPILMCAPMVRATLRDVDPKGQTRRVLKGKPPPGAQRVIRPFRDERLQWAATDPHDMEQGQIVLGEAPRCPYGMPGDRLWVREAWRTDRVLDKIKPSLLGAGAPIFYEADAPHQPSAGRLRPGMFMPRWASRITLEVTGVRVERLQDISEEDAIAEGIAPEQSRRFEGGARGCYRDLWESINGPGSWAANPWVWVVEFRRV